MVSRFPDTIVITWKSDGTYTDLTGDYTAGTTITKTVTGRKEPNGGGRLIALEDGGQIVYNWLFICKKQDFTAPINADVSINSGEWTGKVKRQVNDQTGTRIWL